MYWQSASNSPTGQTICISTVFVVLLFNGFLNKQVTTENLLSYSNQSSSWRKSWNRSKIVEKRPRPSFSSLAFVEDEESSEIAQFGSSLNTFNQDKVPLVRLTRDILAPNKYDVRIRPVQNHSNSLKIHISMSLYQIIDVNEPAQNIKMNVWMIQKWRDEMLDWDPREYDLINATILPHEVLWVPDTYLYNSVVMNPDETERYMNIRADSLFWEGKRGANMSFLYPAIYTVTCRLNIRYFPYDQQNCTLTISSWTNSKSALDYRADERVNMASYIPNEEWDVVSFKIFRHEYKYACCPEPWVILEASLVLRRKPLYYVINLIIPTSIITLVAITGFFTPASTADDRTEKINLGITTLLAMSILMLMVSDQMPTTSEFVPLIAWFYLSIIIIISIGTFLTSVILSIQGRRQYGRVPPVVIRYIFFVKIINWLCLSVPPQLYMLWEEMDDHPSITYQSYFAKLNKRRFSKKEQADEPEKEESVDDTTSTNRAQLTHQDSQFDDRFLAPPSTYGASPVSLNFPPSDGILHKSRPSSITLEKPAPTDDKEPNRARHNWKRVGYAAASAASDMRLNKDYTRIQLQSRQNSRKGRSRRSSSILLPMIDLSPMEEASTPSVFKLPPPLTLSSKEERQKPAMSRQSSGAGAWDNAIQVMGVLNTHRRSQEDTARGGQIAGLTSTISADLISMKRRRQCSLEWEFIATILDRIFLILFTLTVLTVTAGMMVTGRMAQFNYEQLDKELG